MINTFRKMLLAQDESFLCRLALEVLQVNLGNICNQRCIHCHINASPRGNIIMPKRIMDEVVKFLSRKEGLSLDITGGCPELNPHLRYLIKKAKPYVKRIMVRNNLTIFFEKGMQDWPEFYQKNKIKLICSLPCYTKENVEKQRGEGVFTRSIKALKLLNKLGYGKEKSLQLDLVYNPGGAFLPAEQSKLEQDYKRVLSEQYGIVFNHLLTMTNAPINRFAYYLKANGSFAEYMKLLMDNFNREVAGNIMCRSLLNVGWDGTIYDCDFNQALGLAIRDKRGRIMKIGGLHPRVLQGREIIFAEHCFCCTAGAGSSCSGALVNQERK